MVSLFTRRASGDGMQLEADDAATPAVNMETYFATLLKTVRKFPRLSAPGLLQMRNEHLMVIAETILYADNL